MSDLIQYGDRRADRRETPRERRNDRRGAYPGAGRAFRKGPCKVCREDTDHVGLWNGKPVNLCPECAAAIRSPRPRSTPLTPTMLHEDPMLGGDE